MESTVSGFKVQGSWSEIVEHGRQVTRVLEALGVADQPGDRGKRYRRALDEWEHWRPKPHEGLEPEISQKTAEQASIDEGAGEQVGARPMEDAATAGRKLGEAIASVGGGMAAVMQRLGETFRYAGRAADSAGRKTLRLVETTVYERVMTRIAPYYFDNELVSAHLHEVSNGSNGSYVLEINVNDDELKDQVAEQLEPGPPGVRFELIGARAHHPESRNGASVS